ncbi:FAD-linked oxidase C-terminal domain-containing protein [Xanthobacter autotrophicus]|uniref:FAD-linked oxidase C-terminal domain-containing protein n=1 Tax=Xanthobacter autotrophicus TaxID=280 RepID=UPI003727E116
MTGTAPGLRMPDADARVLARRNDIIADLKAIVPGEGVIAHEREMRPYESDALTAYKQLPLVVVLPSTTAQVAAVLKYCHDNEIRVVPRGAGTSLSGGALPLEDAVLLGLGKFNRIIEIDTPNRCAVVQPGVTNLGISKAVDHLGFYYAPDPSSQIACTIGGNVAENSGGVHCLKYGLTTNNVLGAELVLITGEIVRLGGKHLDAGGLDLLSVIIGSEGLLGVVTEVTVRLLKKPDTARAVLVGFPTSEDAGACVAKIIGGGIIPAAIEMMDKDAIAAAEAFVNVGYPLDVEALLIVELDGPEAECAHLLEEVTRIAQDCNSVTLRVSTSEAERLGFWAGRKAAFPAVGRLSPDYLCMDGTIPRRQLPFVLARMRELGAKYGLRCANVFHAGDGNLHPLILYDANAPGELHAAESFGADILRLCVEVGGVLTGEHGVGVEKRDLMDTMFNEVDLAQQQRMKCAFDDKSLLNPGKVFPTLHRCAEFGRMHVSGGALPFPDLPRF